MAPLARYLRHTRVHIVQLRGESHLANPDNGDLISRRRSGESVIARALEKADDASATERPACQIREPGTHGQWGLVIGECTWRANEWRASVRKACAVGGVAGAAREALVQRLAWRAAAIARLVHGT